VVEKKEPTRWRIQYKEIERIPLCTARKGKEDADGDFWLVDCDLDFDHKGDHDDKHGTVWANEEQGKLV
jgi:hypothetical protein